MFVVSKTQNKTKVLKGCSLNTIKLKNKNELIHIKNCLDLK